MSVSTLYPGGAYPPLGPRVLIWGCSCAGKSTLAERLALIFASDFVDLDALNWLPNWVGLNATDPERLLARIQEATAGDAWVVAGSYTVQSQVAFWPRLTTIVWIDIPLPILLYRVVTRSWRRWRSRELLWGTNRENFWQQLAIWNKEDSLIWWILKTYQPKRDRALAYIRDPKWSHIQWVRLSSTAQIEDFVAQQQASLPAAHL